MDGQPPLCAQRRRHGIFAARGAKRVAGKGILVLSDSRAYGISGAVHERTESIPPIGPPWYGLGKAEPSKVIAPCRAALSKIVLRSGAQPDPANHIRPLCVQRRRHSCFDRRSAK